MAYRVTSVVWPGLVLTLAGLLVSEEHRTRQLAAGWILPGCWATFWHHGYLWAVALGLGGGVLRVRGGLAGVAGCGLLGGAVALFGGMVYAELGRGANPSFPSVGSPPGTPSWPTPALDLFLRRWWPDGGWVLLGAAAGVAAGWATRARGPAEPGTTEDSGTW